METGKHLSRTLKVICNNFQSSVLLIDIFRLPSFSLPHLHLHPSRREIESKSDSPRRNCLHRPRHGQRPRPLGILPSRNQPVFFQMSREHQQTTSVRERSMTKTRNPEVCRWLSLFHVCSIALAACALSKSFAKTTPVRVVFSGTIGGSAVLCLISFTFTDGWSQNTCNP